MDSSLELTYQSSRKLVHISEIISSLPVSFVQCQLQMCNVFLDYYAKIHTYHCLMLVLIDCYISNGRLNKT
ncbi:hypothetical protein VNO77_06809 [Canavalia gladiata]|uniref:Uncharacterized protein n=1 Tax=Canavalia gladiata TaxID=3824 RepID=A0AAN9MCP6_CANGL